MNVCGTVPLLSPWLYRRAVRSISHRAAAGDLPAVKELAAAFCTTSDPGTRDLAGQGLMHLRTPEQADLLLRDAILRDNPLLLALARESQCLPAALPARALWYLCTSQIDNLHRIDPEDHLPLLAAGYAAADAPVRLQARNAARRDGTVSTLARALAGTRVTQNAPSWTYDEWDTVITGFARDGRLDDLWLLVPLAPVPLAVTGMKALRDAGWVPQGDDRIPWDELSRSLPERWSDPQPAGRPRTPVGRPAGQVARFSFSPDGSLCATGSCDGMITVWRTASPGAAAEFAAGPGTVRFLAIIPGNARVVSACDDGTIRCHDIGERALLWSQKTEGSSAAFTLSPDGRIVYSGDERGVLEAHDTRDGRHLHSQPLHPSPVTCIAPAPSGPGVACGHADGTISLARPGDIPGIRHIPGNGSPVSSLAFTPPGTECLAVYGQAHPVLWDIVRGEKCRTFAGHAGRTVCAAVPAAGGWFAVASDDHTIRCWDMSAVNVTAAVPFYNRRITSCTATPDGSLLVAGLHDGQVRILRMPQGRQVREFKGHKKTITSCTIAPDVTRLATASWDGTMKIWRLPEGEIVRTIDPHAGGIAALAGPSGTRVAAVTGDGLARIIDASDGSVVRTIDLYTQSVRSAAMSPDGTYLAVTGTDPTLRCWNTRDGSLAAATDRHTTSWRCCTFLPGGDTLVTGGWDGSCRLYRMPDAVPLRTFSGHTSIVTCCSVSRDGTILATGSNDTTVRLWHPDSDGAYAVLRDFRSEVGAVTLSPDGTYLAAGSSDREIRLYRLPYGIPERGLPGLPGRVTALAITGNGCILAAGYDTGTIALFSLPDRSLLRIIPAHNGSVTGLAVPDDDAMLVSAGADGLCRFHALPRARFCTRASPGDIPAADDADGRMEPGTGSGQARFHRALLAARFRGEIGICPPADPAGLYDIQIMG